MVAATNADLAILNSGTFRSDMIHSAGPFFLKDLLKVLPMIDPLVLLELTVRNFMNFVNFRTLLPKYHSVPGIVCSNFFVSRVHNYWNVLKTEFPCFQN